MSAAIDFDSSAIAAAKVAFGPHFTDEAGKVIEDTMRLSGKAVRAAVVKRAKPHRRTGRMERSIKTKKAGAGWKRTVTVRAGGRVAHLIALGVAPHDITSDGPMPIGGGRFAMSVSHPGFRGDHFFRNGVRDSVPKVNKILSQKGDALLALLKAPLK